MCLKVRRKSFQPHFFSAQESPIQTPLHFFVFSVEVSKNQPYDLGNDVGFHVQDIQFGPLLPRVNDHSRKMDDSFSEMTQNSETFFCLNFAPLNRFSTTKFQAIRESEKQQLFYQPCKDLTGNFTLMANRKHWENLNWTLNGFHATNPVKPVIDAECPD